MEELCLNGDINVVANHGHVFAQAPLRSFDRDTGGKTERGNLLDRVDAGLIQRCIHSDRLGHTLDSELTGNRKRAVTVVFHIGTDKCDRWKLGYVEEFVAIQMAVKFFNAA